MYMRKYLFKPKRLDFANKHNNVISFGFKRTHTLTQAHKYIQLKCKEINQKLPAKTADKGKSKEITFNIW